MGTTALEAQRQAQRVQEELEYALASRGLPPCTVSIGIASGAGGLQETINLADEALRRAKRQGRNRVLSAG
jgi:PleD family two-component response regulator